ncbi:MAG TPA: NAD-dependent epimerase/dehydratase family protein [Edaphobacter sp.]|uniref:GDP-mannose 4,6-dehydratase n=1 Tax=Edaphobacter sp. TaxID=1934404 RepID=UPI002C3E1D52|nr:NAD-dependent epimerase/dehydratase family protein [Edaphobacter sp.]HUZ96445.1 NAD-dependent epimerase/dehydratase family protein [Edaphobacter sp.]
MKVLITGGAGFIGSHLAERCLAREDDVFVVDDLSTGSVENIRHLKAHKRFSYFLDSVENRQLTAELVDECDVVFHLAAAVGVRLIVESPVRTIETNVRATELVLSLAAKKKKRVLITSTSEVYGKRTQMPFREDDDLLMGPSSKGRWSYACSKALDEFLALAYWKEKRVPTTVVRLFNTVGPRQTGRYGMVVPSFVRQALQNENITIFGDGTQRRCFLHVADAVEALLALMLKSEAVGEVYNIGSAEEVTIRGLAEKVKAMTKSASQIVLIPYNEAYEEGFEDMLRRVPDISKLRALTGFVPRYALDDTLRDVIAYTRTRVTSTDQMPLATDRRTHRASRQIAWQTPGLL